MRSGLNYRFLMIVKAVVMAVFVINFATSCWRNVEPYHVIQLCLNGPNGRTDLLQAIDEIAKQTGLRLVDSSRETSQQLIEVGAQKHIPYDIKNNVNIGLFKDKEVKVMAGNLGLPDDQVVISFFGDEGSSSDLSLVKSVTNAVANFSLVRPASSRQGAMPIECKSIAGSDVSGQIAKAKAR